MNSKRRASIRDVAEAAGVSITTVSHVLNAKGRASEHTKKIVLAAAERVGYRPDPVARSLRTGATGVLGIIFRPSDAIIGSMKGTEFHIRVAGGAATAAINRGYGLLHMPSPGATSSRVFPIDGCIVVSPTEQDSALTYFLKRKVPVVSVDREHGSDRVPWHVDRDDAAGMIALLTHMASTGARRFLFLSGQDRNDWLLQSEKAFKLWTSRNGVNAALERVAETSGAEGAREKALSVMKGGKDSPDAIVTATSRFAVGVIEAARMTGHAIPTDVRIATLSDSELARSHDIPITALDLHGDRAGRDSVDLMLALLSSEAPVQREAIVPTLRVRGSTSQIERASSS